MTTNARLSPSITERQFDRYGTDDDHINGMAYAVKGVREACEKAVDVADKIRKDPMVTALANERKVRKTTFDLVLSATPRLDKARDAAQAEIATLEAKTAAPAAPKDAIGELREAELRAALAKMDSKARAKVVHDGIANGDDLLVGAALRSHPLTSGMGPAEIEMRRHEWRAARFPAEVSRIDKLKRAVADLDRIGSLAVGFVNGLTDADEIERAERLEREAKEAAA